MSQLDPDPHMYRRVLANREARGLLIAQATSELGDQVARVAIALLVLERTHEVVYAALALAVAYIPGILGGAVLGSLADRYPRRSVMLACDLGRFFLVGLLAVLATASSPLWLLYLLLLASEFVSQPFTTARASLYPDVLSDRTDYMAAQGLSRTIHLATQVVGSVAGGLLVQLLSPRIALAIDAGTFLVSYTIIRLVVSIRPSAGVRGTSIGRLFKDLSDGASELFNDPVRRSVTLLGWCSALFLVAPEAVALGYRPDLAPTLGGVLLAAVPAGSAVGAFLLPNVPLAEQVRLLLPLAALSCLPQFATSVNPPPLIAAALWFVAGFLQAYVLTIIAVVALKTATDHRGRVLGVASGGFSAATAIAFVVVGWLAGQLDPGRAVSLAGALGLILVGVLWATWPHRAFEQEW